MFFTPINSMYFFSMIVLVPGVIFYLYAQHKIKSTYTKFSQVPAQSGLTGAQASRKILDQAGLQDVGIEEIPGQLSDHYDPKARVVRLSQGAYRGNSLAALGVAAHETGHAIQDASNYAPMRVRSTLVPAANIGSQFGMMIFFFGLFMAGLRGTFMAVGMALVSMMLLFQLVTMPVELDASSRAMKLLQSSGIVMGPEAEGAGKVLRAAALTYVAAALMTVLTLVRMFLISRSR